jgi:hypothetical protein
MVRSDNDGVDGESRLHRVLDAAAGGGLAEAREIGAGGPVRLGS